MSVRIVWRSAVFLMTLAFIYLAFPILIVPSSLPAIKMMLVDNELPRPESPGAIISQAEADAKIYELSVPEIPSLKDKLEVLKTLHEQGMQIILNPVSLWLHLINYRR